MFGYGTMGDKRTVVCQVGNFPVRYKYHEGEMFLCCMLCLPSLTNPFRHHQRGQACHACLGFAVKTLRDELSP